MPHSGDRLMVKSWAYSGEYSWAFTKGIYLKEGNPYDISFWYQAKGYGSGSSAEYDNFKVQIGMSKTLTGTGVSAQMTNAETILTVQNQKISTWTEKTYTFTPDVSGIYYLGFHDMTTYNTGFLVAIDDVKILGDRYVDIGVVELLEPVSEVTPLTAANEVTVKLKNYGTVEISNIPITLKLDGVLMSEEVVNTTIAPDGTYDFTFAQTIDLSGGALDYVIEVSISVVGDVEVSNDTLVEHIVGDVSIKNPIDGSVISIYPNPVKDMLFIQSTELVKYAEVYDIQGKLVKTILNNAQEISVDDLKAGTYMVRLTTDKAVTTLQFIKQ
jgi:hypothetical protein